MPAEVVILEEEVAEIHNEIVLRIEGVGIEELIFEDAEKGFDFAVGLGSVGPGVTVFDSQLPAHRFKGVLTLQGPPELTAVIGQDGLELKVVYPLEPRERSGHEVGER